MDRQGFAAISARYLRFANEEARGNSPLYEALARAIAADRLAIGFLAALPNEKRQPNLLLAAMRHRFGTPEDWTEFRRNLAAEPDAVRAIMLERSTQTNEPARCATLLPVLARLPQPLALIEVGAAAGLCLLPDFYGYDYGDRQLRPGTMDAPVFACRASATTPLPPALPRVVWRAGLDLRPLDAADPPQAGWLETLVWPEQTGRLANLRRAIKIAASVRPRVVQGDLLGDGLAQLCAQAPKAATLVIFHSAVLAYVPGLNDRQAFARRAMSLCRYWISNESARVFSDDRDAAGADAVGTTSPGAGRFLLSVNGAPVAWAHPHGASLDWINPMPMFGGSP